MEERQKKEKELEGLKRDNPFNLFLDWCKNDNDLMGNWKVYSISITVISHPFLIFYLCPFTLPDSLCLTLFLFLFLIFPSCLSLFFIFHSTFFYPTWKTHHHFVSQIIRKSFKPFILVFHQIRRCWNFLLFPKVNSLSLPHFPRF